MRTKQEIIDFLESKVGTKVKCVGNSSLDGQCVTLIKALMDFLGVPEPYKARGNANSCISKYLSEGIAEPGMGFISVFSNKDMAKGVGHIWCNAGEGAGTFYESNGVKPLIVTKGKTYIQDTICNFDKYIKEEVTTSDNTQRIADLEKEVADKNLQIKGYDEQVKGLSKKYEEEHNLRIEAEAKAKGFKDERDSNLAQCANELGTRQEIVDIVSAIKALVTRSDDYTEYEKKVELDKKEEAYQDSLREKKHKEDMESLGKELKTAKDLLATLQIKYDALVKPKDTQITPSISTPKYSILDTIKSLFGIK